MAYFDDVFIPWGQVQHVGNPDHAKWYPQRQFDWVHLETQIRHCVHAELMVGLGLLLTQALGTSTNPIVQTQRSEEHTSELQSLMRISYAVFCLKKKTNNKDT